MPIHQGVRVSVLPVDAELQTLTCRAGLAVAVLDGSGHVSLPSPGMERLLNRSLAETVDHHVRIPLTPVLGHAELLMDRQDDLPPEATPSVEALWRADQRLDDVVTWISERLDLATTWEARQAESTLDHLDRDGRP